MRANDFSGASINRSGKSGEKYGKKTETDRYHLNWMKQWVILNLLTAV